MSKTFKHHQEFDNIYLKHFEPMCLYAHRFFPDKDDVTEIVQEVMLKLWNKLKEGQEIESIDKYLYRSVHNYCINKIEHNKVHNRYVNNTRVQLIDIEREDYESHFHQWEIKESINNEVNNLSPKLKEVFTLRYFDGMRYKQIAQKLDISERTVESHLQDALKKLRIKLKKFL